MLSIDKATEQKYGFSTKRTKEDFDAWRNTGREFAARNRKQTIKRLTREAIKTKRYNGKIWIKNNIVSKIDPYTNMFGPSQYMAEPIKNYHGV